MTEKQIRQVLDAVRAGRISPLHAIDRLRRLPFEDLGFAKIDHHRNLRQGFPEVVLAEGKQPTHVVAIVRRMLCNQHNILITRADRGLYGRIKRLTRQARFHELSGAIAVHRDITIYGKGTILVLTAGTSDIPVAEEAKVTAEIMGNHVETIYDVGVAGLHRLIRYHDRLRRARVVICIAGMEGALPSVVAGLLAMLNTCASNVSVVNIDNGFGAGYVASVINRL